MLAGDPDRGPRGYEKIAKGEYARSSADCGCDGRNPAKPVPWDVLIRDGYVEDGKIAVHIRYEETGARTFAPIVFYERPSVVASGEFDEWLAWRDEQAGIEMAK